MSNCQNQRGYDIKTKEECSTACLQLQIDIEKLKENKPCYLAGNGKCRQTGRFGSKAYMICGKEGNLHPYKHVVYLSIY